MQKGMSLVEMLVVVAVIAILARAAVPVYTNWVARTQLIAATNELHGAMLYARSEAIKRNARVSVCPSSNGSSCLADGNWHNGWVVFHDPNNNASLDAGEAVLRRQGEQRGVTISGNATLKHYVSYVASGATQLTNGGLQMGTITLCGMSEGRQLIISASGRPRIQTVESC